MAANIIVPAIGESVTEAVIARWYVQEGDLVSKDQPVCEIESDKVNIDLPAPEGGRLLSVLKKADETVSVGETVGRIEVGAGARADSSVEKDAAAPKTAEGDRGAMVAKDSGVSSAAEGSRASSEKPVSPAVRRLLSEHDAAVGDVAGTGPGGRVTKGDVLAHVERVAAGTSWTPPVQAANAGQSHPGHREERVRMSPLRKKVAERLVEVQHTAAILTTFNEVDMSRVIAIRKQYQDHFVKRYDIKLGFMPFFVKACVEALKAYPGANAEIRGEEIVYKRYYDVGVAVGGGKGLVVPVVRSAERMSFAELELAIAELARKARDNKLTLEELTGGTFTISNGGIYGSLMSTPILNPPQTGILGMHKIQDRAMVVDKQVVVRPMMYLALSYDHRVIDGREAVSFLVRVKECIEDPERILLEV